MKALLALKWLMDKVLELSTVLFFVGMISVVLIQVVTRFALPQAPHWTEEAARILFIYTCACAAGLAMKHRAYVAVDTFVSRLGAQSALVMDCLVIAVIAGFMFFVAWLSTTFVSFGAMQLSSSLRIPMSYVFATTFIMSVFIGVYGLIEIGKNIQTLLKGGDQS